ncbi:MAG: hypothetical protein AB1445_05785 [Bacillota bacterium]
MSDDPSVARAYRVLPDEVWIVGMTPGTATVTVDYSGLFQGQATITVTVSSTRSITRSIQQFDPPS